MKDQSEFSIEKVRKKKLINCILNAKVMAVLSKRT